MKNRTNEPLGMIISTSSFNQYVEGASLHTITSSSTIEPDGLCTYESSHNICLMTGSFDVPPHDLEGK